MVPLCHSPPEPDELRFVLSGLRAARIGYREAQGNFLTPATIWIEEANFEAASSVFKQCFTEYAEAQGKRRRPSTKLLPRRARPWQIWRSSAFLAILALILMVGTFAGYPLLMALGVVR